jgi:hypothetical protein
LTAFLLRLRTKERAGPQWLTPIIPATQEAEIRRIMVWSQPQQIVFETLCGKNPSQEKSLKQWKPLPSKYETLSSNPSAAKKKNVIFLYKKLQNTAKIH